MTETMKKEREALLDYGRALQEMATEILPVFDNIVVQCEKTAGNLVRAQQEVENLRRSARTVWLKDLIKMGATPEDAVKLVRFEMELAAEGSVDWPAVAGQIAPSFMNVVMSMVGQAMVQSGGPEVQSAFDALFNMGVSSQAPEGDPGNPQEE